MATKLFEVPDKYIDIIDMEYDLFLWRNSSFVFYFKFRLKYVSFHYLLKYITRECVTMVTNHTVTF